MKVLFILLLSMIITIPTALGLVLSEDGTGLTHTFIVQTGGYDFPVQVTGNLDVTDLSFDKDMKIITLYIDSSLDYNLLEILIPTNLINGEFTFLLDSSEIFPKVSDRLKRKKESNKADAILIASYYYNTYKTE